MSVRWNDGKSGNPPLASAFSFFGWENSAVRLVYDGFQADGHGIGVSS